MAIVSPIAHPHGEPEYGVAGARALQVSRIPSSRPAAGNKVSFFIFVTPF
jgi:hypothetical protein